jgi:uncharacterized membrane protein
MLDVINDISEQAGSPESRQALLRHVNLILAESQAGELIEQDRQRIQCKSESITMKLSDVKIADKS